MYNEFIYGILYLLFYLIVILNKL